MSPSKKKRRMDRASSPKPRTGLQQEPGLVPPAEKKPAAGLRQEAGGPRAVAGRPKPGEAPARWSYRQVLSAPLFWLAGIIAIALVVRLLPLLYCLKDGHILVVDPDSYYHLRRITYIVQHFPGVNIYDSYVNYPQGYFIGWPPLFDLTAAIASLAAGLGHPDRLAIEVASSAVNVGLGLLGIVAAFFLAKDIFGEKAALAGAFVMAILPATVFVTIFGYAGHHSLAMAVSVAMYLLFLRSVTGGKREGVALSRVRWQKGPMVYAALAGVAVAASVFAWDGTPYFIGTLVLYAFVLYARDAFRGESTEYLTVSGVVTAVVALVLVAPAAVTGYHGQQMEITAIYLSWFHVIMLAGLGLFFVFMGSLEAARKKAGLPWPATPAAALLAAGVTLLAMRELSPRLFQNLVEGMSFLSGGTALLSSISEVSPLLGRNGQFSLNSVWVYFGTALLVAIPGLLAYLYSLRKAPPGPGEIFFLLWTGVVTIMCLMQTRFADLLGINVSLLAGYGIYRAAGAAGLGRFVEANFGDGRRAKRTPAKRRLRVPAGLAVLAIALALLLFQPLVYACMIATSPLPATANWDDAAVWIRDHTPATSYTYSADMGTMPEYGVMTWWDYGNYILYRAERPAVANNFQTGVGDAARFFVAPDEATADRVLEERHAKYVAVDYMMEAGSGGIPDVFDSMAKLAGKDAATYFMSFRRLDPAAGGTVAYFDGNDRYYGTMYSRLFNDLGLGGRNRLGNITSGLQHYRMVYANSGSNPVIVFERVAGATIAGRAPPGRKVDLRLDVADSTGNGTYYSTTMADQAGAYSFTVPYATGDTSGAVKTGNYYVITSGSAKAEVAVPEDAVQGGTTIGAGGLQ